MFNLYITDYGTLKSDNPNFKEKTIEDFLKEIEKNVLEESPNERKIFIFEQKENECKICLGLNEYKIRLDSEDSKKFKILSYYNKLTNQLKKYNCVSSKRNSFELISFFGSAISMGMSLIPLTNMKISMFFIVLIAIVFSTIVCGVLNHIFNHFIKKEIKKIHNELEEKNLDLVKEKTLEDILKKDKKITAEEQKLLSDSIVLNEVAKLSIKIDSLNHQDKVIFAKRLKQLLNDYKEKVNSLNSSSEIINLQINDIIYIEREILGILSVMDLECDKLIHNDTKKKQYDKTIGILDDQLGEMIQESSNGIYSEGGVQYIKNNN